jgi:hypothetical protein
MDEFALWGTARKMRELYGMFAAITASQRARKAFETGDLDRYDRWMRIAEMLSTPGLHQPVGGR